MCTTSSCHGRYTIVVVLSALLHTFASILPERCRDLRELCLVLRLCRCRRLTASVACIMNRCLSLRLGLPLCVCSSLFDGAWLAGGVYRLDLRCSIIRRSCGHISAMCTLVAKQLPQPTQEISTTFERKSRSMTRCTAGVACHTLARPSGPAQQRQRRVALCGKGPEGTPPLKPYMLRCSGCLDSPCRLSQLRRWHFRPDGEGKGPGE